MSDTEKSPAAPAEEKVDAPAPEEAQAEGKSEKPAEDSSKESRADLFKKVEELQEACQFAELHELMVSLVPDCMQCDEGELCWRLGRSFFNLGGETTDAKLKQAHYSNGLKCCSRCIELDPGVGPGHKWWGILTSKMGDFISTKEKIANAQLIKDAIEKAIAIMPDDATCHHVLGMWHFNVAGISWIERNIAKAIFGTPPASTYDDAIGPLLRCHELRPDFLNNMLALGDVYAAKKDAANAKKWYTMAASYPPKSEADKRDVAAAAAKAAKW